MIVTWYIYRRCPTINDWNGPKKWKYAKLAKEWLHEFPPASRQKAKGKRMVLIIRVFKRGVGQRRYDLDNLRGGVKVVVDALKKTGWLVNDSPKWCEIVVDQRHPVAGEWTPSTVVSVSDIT